MLLAPPGHYTIAVLRQPLSPGARPARAELGSRLLKRGDMAR